MFTPKGLSVRLRARSICFFRYSALAFHGGDDPQAAAVGNGRRQLPSENPGHAALENGVLNAQKVADGRFNHDIPSFPGGLGPPVKILYPAARQPKSCGRCPVLILPPDDTCRGGKAAAKGGKHHIVAPLQQALAVGLIQQDGLTGGRGVAIAVDVDEELLRGDLRQAPPGLVDNAVVGLVGDDRLYLVACNAGLLPSPGERPAP